VTARLYWFPISHPSHAVRRMLELKGIPYDLVEVLPGNQRVHLRLAGFRGGTVPAMKLDGRRIQGSRPIARALEELQPEPSLFPAGPAARASADEVERWGDEEFQMVPRRIMRWGLAHDPNLRRWMADESPAPGPAGVVATVTKPVALYYAWLVKANEDAARSSVAALPGLLDRVDVLLAEGTISVDRPTAATYQVLCTVRALGEFSDLHDLVATHPSAAAAQELFPEDFSSSPVPPFVPADWLPDA
jgi:glutathione S-transferase